MEKKFTQKADTIANLEHVENVNTEHVHARIDHANTVNFYGAQKQPSRFLQKIRKLNKKRVIIWAVIIILILLIISPYVYSRMKWNAYDKVYQALSGKANSAFFNGNYEEAASLYHEIAEACVDDLNYSTTACYEGLCYYLLAINAEDTALQANRLNQSFRIFSEIYADKYKIAPCYYFAASYISQIYDELDYASNQTEQIDIISLLDTLAAEDIADSTAVLHSFFHDNQMVYSDVMRAVYEALTRYHANTFGNVFRGRQLAAYYERLIAFQQERRASSIADSGYFAMLLDRSANTQYMQALTKEPVEAVSSIKGLVDYYEDFLSNFEFTAQNIPIYTSLLHAIGKGETITALLYESEIDDPTSAELYKEKAYRTMKPLLYLDTQLEDGSLSEIVTTSIYFIATEQCTEEDYIRMVNNMAAYVKTQSFQNQPMIERLVEEAGYATTCGYILKNYGYIEEVRSAGVAFSTDTITLAEALGDPLHYLDTYQSILEFFQNFDAGNNAEDEEVTFRMEELKRTILVTFPSYEDEP